MMYDSSVPVFSHFLKALSAILKKAEAHCEAKKIDPDALLKARLFPDMFRFTRQVQTGHRFRQGRERPACRHAGAELSRRGEEFRRAAGAHRQDHATFSAP